jgi:hypothetical protein
LEQDEEGGWWDGNRGPFFQQSETLRIGWHQGKQPLVDEAHMRFLCEEIRAAANVCQLVHGLHSETLARCDKARKAYYRAQDIRLALHPEEEIPF